MEVTINRSDTSTLAFGLQAGKGRQDVASKLSWAEILWISKGKPVKGTIAALHDAEHVDEKLLPCFLIASLPQVSTDYLALAKMMDLSQPLFAVYLPSEMRRPENGMSVQKLAEYYADAIAEFRPHGPVALGGWSAGAPLAEAAARRLQQRGREVRLLVIIDGQLPSVAVRPLNLFEKVKIACYRVSHGVKDLADFLNGLGRQLRSGQSSFGQAFRSCWKASAFRKKWAKMAMLIRNSTRTGSEANGALHPAELISDIARFPSDHRAFARTLYDALVDYVPQKDYAGDMLVFESTKEPDRTNEKIAEKWKAFARNVTVVRIKGSHKSIVLPPDALPLAQHLSWYLRRYSQADGAAHIAKGAAKTG